MGLNWRGLAAAAAAGGGGGEREGKGEGEGGAEEKAEGGAKAEPGAAGRAGERSAQRSLRPLLRGPSLPRRLPSSASPSPQFPDTPEPQAEDGMLGM